MLLSLELVKITIVFQSHGNQNRVHLRVNLVFLKCIQIFMKYMSQKAIVSLNKIRLCNMDTPTNAFYVLHQLRLVWNHVGSPGTVS